MKKVDPVLHEKLVTLISSMGYELVGCDIQASGKSQVFRIYIDAEKGVTIDDCSKVSHQVGAMLEVYGSFSGRYVLEVSSPGIDRPLFELKDYQKAIGKEVRIKLYAPLNERRQYKGIVTKVEGEDIYILCDEIKQAIKLPFSLIEKANVIGDVRF